MKITLLTSDLSNNCLGRSYLLAKILQKHYDVEIVGPISEKGIWEPVAGDKSIKYKYVKFEGRIKPYLQALQLVTKIEGDVIYASKPLFTSYGIGLIEKILHKKPLILDIDDWQMGFIHESYKKHHLHYQLGGLVYSALFFYRITSYWNNYIFEKLSFLADEITVSNNFLKDKFGGTIIWHGRDTEYFDPKNFDKNSIRKRYNIDRNKKIIMFFGTPRPHKGVEDLINSISTIKDNDVILLIVGIDHSDLYCQKLIKTGKKILGERLKEFGLQPFELIPEFLAMADLVVIPQKQTFATLGQIPAKVFDAMAMAKPIIATKVSDLPLILEGCGKIVEPSNPRQLSENIQFMLNNPERAKEMGTKARKKCIGTYSWHALDKVLLNIFKKYDNRNKDKKFNDR